MNRSTPSRVAWVGGSRESEEAAVEKRVLFRSRALDDFAAAPHEHRGDNRQGEDGGRFRGCFFVRAISATTDASVVGVSVSPSPATVARASKDYGVQP